jgi:hypothetical protein
VKKLIKLLRENDYYTPKEEGYFDNVLTKVKAKSKSPKRLNFERFNRLVLNPLSYSFGVLLIGVLTFFLVFKTPSIKKVSTSNEYLNSISYDEAEVLYYENYDIIADAKSGVTGAKQILYSEILKTLKQENVESTIYSTARRRVSDDILTKKASVYTQLLIDEDMG